MRCCLFCDGYSVALTFYPIYSITFSVASEDYFEVSFDLKSILLVAKSSVTQLFGQDLVSWHVLARRVNARSRGK